MSVDLLHVISMLMPILALLGQPIRDAVIAKGVDATVDAIRKRFDKDRKNEAVFNDWEKDPNNVRRQSELMDVLRATLKDDPDFLRELAHLVAEVGPKDVLPSIQPPPPPVALHQLPADITEFTGRQDELAALQAGAKQAGTAPPLLIVTGIGGSGKSALALHTAHLLKEQFPDGQLYVDLQGTSLTPKTSDNVLAGFLRALGVQDASIPRDLGERVGLYRSLLAGKRAIILLDNARNEAQVRPLLPGDANCVVLVTSRWSLNALGGKPDLKLAMLTETDALALLERLIGKERVSAESGAARRIVQLCGCLPLAVRIAGGQLKSGYALSQYTSRLRDERGRLEQLHLSDLDVRACFALSYQNLSPEEARLFRMLGLPPGEMFASAAALALAGAEEQGAWKLVEAGLLESVGNEQFRFHDLVRLFSRELLEKVEPREQEAACLIIARAYEQETREKNDDWLIPEKRIKKVEQLVEELSRPYEAISREEVLKALTWFETERVNLLAAVEWAHEGKDWETTWRLAENLANFYNLRCHWTEWERTHVLALDATRRGHNIHKEGTILNLLGNVYRLQGHWDKAVDLFQEALRLHRKLQNPLGESIALNLLANVYRLQGRWDEAITAFQEGLEINQKNANRYGESIALGGLGNVYRMQGRWDEALKMYDESLKISTEREDKRGQCISLNNMALVHSRVGRLDQAETELIKSQSISEEMKLPRGDCIAIRTLGEVRVLQDRLDEANNLLMQSLELAKKQDDRRCTSQSLNSLGECNLKLENWEQADNRFDEALSILYEMGDRHGMGLVLRNKGRLFMVQNREVEAETLWRGALEKLHPGSPEFREVAMWLQETEHQTSMA